MQLVRDALLADAGLAGDQDRHVRGGDNGGLLEQPLQGGAAADHPTARLDHLALQLARDAAPLLGTLLERLDERGGAQRSTGERPECRQEARVEAVERRGVERVERERADHLAALREGAADAGVDVLERVRVVLDQAVERIGQRAVGGEAHRVGRAQDRVEARVLAAVVTAAERGAHEAMAGHGHERIAFEPQQAGGVGRDHAPYRREQPRVAVAGGERRRQIAGDLEQGRDGGGTSLAALLV